MNVINTLVTINQICKAYGAALIFRSANLPVTCLLPTTNGEVIRCFVDELLNLAGVYADVEGSTVTFTL